MGTGALDLVELDRQLLAIRASTTELPDLADLHWRHLATTIRNEAAGLSESHRLQLRAEIAVPVSSYIEEMGVFQAWMGRASKLAKTDPVITRAQVITQLYVSFIWLRDSLLEPVSGLLPSSATRTVVEFLSTGRRRHLRNAVAHGRWTYLRDFGGLEAWNKDRGGTLTKEIIKSAELAAWQTLARGTSIAVLLSLER